MDTSLVQQQSDKVAIDRVVLHRVRVPLCEPFRISNGEVREKDAILVEVNTTQGLTGWGEASPMAGQSLGLTRQSEE